MSDLISIITVVFNDKQGLENTILSVMSQTYKYIEYIIIDGGSTDGTIDIIKKYQDKTDILWISEPDNGIYDAMNKGIRMATGKWLNFMNAADVFANNKIVEQMVNEFDGSSIVYGNMLRTDGKKKILTKGTHGKNLDAFDFMHSSLCHQAAFIKRSIFQKYGDYTTKYRLASDAEFFFRVIIKNKETYKYVDRTIVIFALGGASSKQRALYDEERKGFLIDYMGESVYQRYEELYWFKYCKIAVILAKYKKNVRDFIKSRIK